MFGKLTHGAKLSLLASLLTAVQLAGSQPADSGIELLSASQISVAQAMQPHVESFIASDPREPKHLLATAMVIINGKTQAYP